MAIYPSPLSFVGDSLVRSFFMIGVLTSFFGTATFAQEEENFLSRSLQVFATDLDDPSAEGEALPLEHESGNEMPHDEDPSFDPSIAPGILAMGSLIQSEENLAEILRTTNRLDRNTLERYVDLRRALKHDGEFQTATETSRKLKRTLAGKIRRLARFEEEYAPILGRFKLLESRALIDLNEKKTLAPTSERVARQVAAELPPTQKNLYQQWRRYQSNLSAVSNQLEGWETSARQGIQRHLAQVYPAMSADDLTRFEDDISRIFSRGRLGRAFHDMRITMPRLARSAARGAGALCLVPIMAYQFWNVLDEPESFSNPDYHAPYNGAVQRIQQCLDSE